MSRCKNKRKKGNNKRSCCFDLHLFHIVRARGKQSKSCKRKETVKTRYTSKSGAPSATIRARQRCILLLLSGTYTWNALHLHGRSRTFSLCITARCDDHIFAASIVRDVSVENMSYFVETCNGNIELVCWRTKFIFPESVQILYK